MEYFDPLLSNFDWFTFSELDFVVGNQINIEKALYNLRDDKSHEYSSLLNSALVLSKYGAQTMYRHGWGVK